jgi:hypothetical protein
MTVVSEAAQNLAIPARYLQITRTNDVSRVYGPDLAFIRIPTGPFLSAISARKSFLNIGVDKTARYAHAMKNIGLIAFAGFPQLYHRALMPQPGFESIDLLNGCGFLTGQEHYERRGQYDYVKVVASYLTGNNPPLTFKGVSGGGMWRVHLILDEPSRKLSHKMYFAGVVFYETALKRNRRRLRAHGPRSLYKVFFPRLLHRYT